MLFDTHAHLNAEQYDTDLEEVIDCLLYTSDAADEG